MALSVSSEVRERSCSSETMTEVWCSLESYQWRYWEYRMCSCETISRRMTDIPCFEASRTSCVFRILRRHKTRYVRKWDWRERRQTLYVCASPGQEVQMDTCFPFWRSRPEVQYDMLDDCSRFVNSQMHMELSVRSSMEFVYKSIRILPFRITAICTDCWVEFWPGFTKFLHNWLGMFGMTPAQKIWHTITKSLLQNVLCTSWDICYSSRDVTWCCNLTKVFFTL